MPGASHSSLPDARTCEQARLSRDARFDGLFFTAVRSTGIYCRPVCPAPAPKPRNIAYYGSPGKDSLPRRRPKAACRDDPAYLKLLPFPCRLERYRR